jgi:predicted GTPase
VQRFATRADLDAADCTIEEREEYEPHIAAGHPVFAGVDYDAIVTLAEKESDLLIWDGGNNDFPFVRPDLHIVLVDALRPDQTTTHHPGETVLRMADVVVVAKTNSAAPAAVEALEAAVRQVRPDVPIVRAASRVRLDNEAAVRGKRALVVEDGPTITHGGMPTGAGVVAAKGLAAELLDPRAFAVPEIAAVYAKHPHIGSVLPAVGYSAAQLRALEATIAASPAEVVVAATPVDLAALIDVAVPVVRARYDFADAGDPPLSQHIDAFLKTLQARSASRRAAD